jgi:hypothetical protein
VRLRSSELSWREIDGEMVVLDLASSRYLTTNRTGSVLMRLLTEECTADELTDNLAAEFGIPREQAREDVEQFVKMLADKGLLDTSDVASS